MRSAEWLAEMWREHGWWGRFEVVMLGAALGVAIGCLGLALVLLWRLL